ncbi:MAG: carbohydrate binding family 9 domain-containing protein, partial [Calditrichaeota bacterium]|nr:carbohydrate binding family 9 domain-containing protein [Calditrichota bacterium]
MLYRNYDYFKELRVRFICLLLIVLSISSQEKKIIDIQKIDAEITIDGIVNEAIWDQIEPLPVNMISPQFKGEMTEKTEIRICYDNNYLYFSGRFYDSQPDQIAANSLIRDKDRGGDFFNVLLDTFNDNENNLVFSTTPAGNRIDNELLNDGEGNFIDIVNYDWNAYWDAKTTQDNTGWFVETRIPFTSLRYNINGDEVIFGFITHRLISRKGERHTFPEIAPNKPLSHLKPSNAAKIRLKGITNKRPLYITPYSLAETGNHSNGDVNL